CSQPLRAEYARYGCRGIRVCERWLGHEGFQNFLADMGERPSRDHSIHRITVNARTLTVAEWERHYGMSRGVIFRRLMAGWSEVDAVTLPKQRPGKRSDSEDGR